MLHILLQTCQQNIYYFETQTQTQTQNVFIQPNFFFYIYIKCNFISDIKQNNIGLGDMH